MIEFENIEITDNNETTLNVSAYVEGNRYDIKIYSFNHVIYCSVTEVVGCRVLGKTKKAFTRYIRYIKSKMRQIRGMAETQKEKFAEKVLTDFNNFVKSI